MNALKALKVLKGSKALFKRCSTMWFKPYLICFKQEILAGLYKQFSEMVRIRTILQISVRIRSEFAQKVRFFQFLSLSLPKNLEKEALA